ncbi:MAG: CTP synthase [Acidobacteria bacterium]|nr:CTP synthase [Acidobacteriota bacterium]MCB9397552.1 CTP synthase [Acidobacteriota bacterium]
MKPIRIALIGDYSPSVTAHRAIPLALAQAGERLGISVAFDWLATDQILPSSAWQNWQGMWVTPGSPYLSESGALLAIRQARETQMPFLGTCGGFQHAMLEYARNVLDWQTAQHAETHSDTSNWVVAPLACSLVEVEDPIHIHHPSLLFDAYGASPISEGYHCRFGLNPLFEERILSRGDWRVSGRASNGEIRALERVDHPFFVATLFQPERRALNDQPVPLVQAFLQACQTA